MSATISKGASDTSEIDYPLVEMLDMAFALADVNIESLSAKPFARLKREIGQFILRAPGDGPGSDTGGLWVGGRVHLEPTTEEVFLLQRSVRALLDAVARRGPLREDELWKPAIRPVVHQDGSVQLAVDEGSLHDRYMLALVARLHTFGADRVRACGICQSAFLRQTRRLYCTRPECTRERKRNGWHKGKHKYRPSTNGKVTSRKRTNKAKGTR